MTNTQKVVLAAVCVSIAAFSYAKMSEPSSYEECLLENMKEAQNDKAALLVNAACRRMFPAQSVFDIVDKQ